VFYNVVLSFYCCFNFLFCIIFFIFTIKIYFNPVCNYLYQLCTNRRRYFILLRGTNTTPALLCPQPRKCFVTVQLLHVFDVDDCDLAVVNVNYEQVCQCYFVYVFCLIPPPPHSRQPSVHRRTSRKTPLSHVKVLRGKCSLTRLVMYLCVVSSFLVIDSVKVFCVIIAAEFSVGIVLCKAASGK
jgi:hypothetical protein